jgi:hypothetical protein
MTSYFKAKLVQSTRVQNALGTQFLIFATFDTDQTKRGIFLVDLGSLPTVDPNDQDALANAITQNIKKLAFQNDNDPIRDQVYFNKHGHYMIDVAGNDNLLSIGLAQKITQNKYRFILTALRSSPTTSSGNNSIIFEKCPNATREIDNVEDITELKVLLIGNDPKLHHTAKLLDGQYSNEMAGH